ncbi:glycoside hydrolase family 18 protein [Neolentinus lepideus HHB14362 ss-1]|uniref:chitinase n=1 Tax=Neolentinus lepideus HHB14362 ss-1 TaxID=1314782 RepID=A0A165R3U6_9AGAM|nr:glycoside hydrolase family 18 protein [Neolentinus lepideus HHB14362 ss-1]
MARIAFTGAFMSSLPVISLLFGIAVGSVNAFDIYWGQDSAGNQQHLAYYCADDTIDTIPLAFLYIFEGPGGEPEIDFGNNDGTFSSTDLAKCQIMTPDIKACQPKGKIVTLSLGGATGKVGFSSDSQAQILADKVWNLFLGGSSSIRPFGDAILDGVDLDIESGTSAHYAAFVNRIRLHASGADKTYYITAAPQCPYPDAYIGGTLNAAPFDAVYMQFYNNDCGLNHPSNYNFGTWNHNPQITRSANKDIKVYIGAAGSSNAAGDGYVDSAELKNYAIKAQNTYSSFGGVMLWDVSEAYANDRKRLSKLWLLNQQLPDLG